MSTGGKIGSLGRADLVKALASTLASGRPGVTAEFIAEQLGLEWVERPKRSRRAAKGDKPTTHHESANEVPLVALVPLLDTSFWILESREIFDSSISKAPPPNRQRQTYAGWHKRPRDVPTISPLATWAELAPKLRRVLSDYREGLGLDIPLTIDRLSQGRLLHAFPRERQRRWGPMVLLIEDGSRRLIPFRHDMRLVRGALRRLLPDYALLRGTIQDGYGEPRRLDDDNTHWLPPPGTLVLVLGDLGSLATTGPLSQQHWLDIGREILEAGSYPLALFPAPLGLCSPALAAIWRLIPWERPVGGEFQLDRTARAERLLLLASPATRIEPGLLRAIRRLLPPDEADAGTEADVWQHPALMSDAAAGATLAPSVVTQFRSLFTSEPLELRRRVLRTIRSWRGYLPEEIWFEELLSVDEATRGSGHGASGPDDLSRDVEDASLYFETFCQESLSPDSAALPDPDLAWLARLNARATEHLWHDPRFGTQLAQLAIVATRDDPEAPLPAGVSPRDIDAKGLPERRIELVQSGAQLKLRQGPEGRGTTGSLLAETVTCNGLIEIALGRDDDRNAFWESGQPPAWASDWGWDDYGAWVEFQLPRAGAMPVAQRMRWIPPGRFLMGSPENEPERDSDEGPQHEVTLAEGYWLFDSACTQALWQAVMGTNPSDFKGDERPVENVSWNDALALLAQINARLPGLALGLPSEAQWEYACRAGTTEPFAFGASITTDQVNYNGNYPYNGAAKGEYRQHTIPVKTLPPNRWGLYEMHGNVLEWTQDDWHDSYRGAPADGAPWQTGRAGARRVVRGGSWNDGARDCRSAYRNGYGPDLRYSVLGFRCARVQGRELRPEAERGALAVQVARPAERIRPGGLHRKGGVGSAEAGSIVQPRTLLRLDASTHAPLPETSAFRLLTDREQLTFRKIIKPDWASAMGRDRFGLWAEIAVEPKQGGDPVVQRLRWIPPGRFTMGSPDNEPGRWEAEGPQHGVVLAQGYWLFDTPCTQSLWVALLGENPSRFVDPQRPVEQVSWEDVQQRFLPALNERLSGFCLPSEAQWEYACRAGTDTALYTGPIEILGDMNAPALHPIAWYGGNSGVEFDLPEGEDSTSGVWWQGKQKQFEHQQAGTRKVKGKLPNAWGLYDMLGNVFEWVEDGWHENYDSAPTDGCPWRASAGAKRVVRGGSWLNDARICRSAYRSRYEPDFRNDDLGFRCARVQGREPSGTKVEAERRNGLLPVPRSGSGRAEGRSGSRARSGRKKK